MCVIQSRRLLPPVTRPDAFAGVGVMEGDCLEAATLGRRLDVLRLVAIGIRDDRLPFSVGREGIRRRLPAETVSDSYISIDVDSKSLHDKIPVNSALLHTAQQRSRRRAPDTAA